MIGSFSSSFAFGRRSSLHRGGSIDIPGTNNSFLRVTNDPAFAPGTGDFTIEWWQYADAYNPYPRLFSIGTYATSPMLALSLEGADADRSMNLWIQGSQQTIATVGETINSWVHFAVVRESGTVKAYKNGINISGAGVLMPDDALYDAGDYFAIGTETTNGATCFGNVTFNGRITQFHYVVGSALYTSDFPRPNQPTEATGNTELLLHFFDRETLLVDISASPKTVTAVGLAQWTNLTPF